MNRRAFLTTLGGAITAVAAKPVLALVPQQPIPLPLYNAPEPEFFPLDAVNALAFALVGGINPRHQEHYRTKALTILAEMRSKRR